MNLSKIRQDPVFKNLEAPLLFAHRGGAREASESTMRAFNHAAKDAKADVLELDVQVTTDEEFVVWHGPRMKNVFVDHQDPRKNDITEFSWKELKDKAWVAAPGLKDLSKIEKADDTKMITLERVLMAFPDKSLNIEMKDDSFRRNHIKRFYKLLEMHRNQRTILVVSQSDSLIERFREECNESFPTGLSKGEALLAVINGALPLIHSHNMSNRALQSSHSKNLTTQKLIEEMHDAGGAVHVFLNGIWQLARALDAEKGQPTRDEVFELLDRGVDGIMTDRPADVRPLINQWKNQNTIPSPS